MANRERRRKGSAKPIGLEYSFFFKGTTRKKEDFSLNSLALAPANGHANFVKEN